MYIYHAAAVCVGVDGGGVDGFRCERVEREVAEKGLRDGDGGWVRDYKCICNI